MVFPARVAAQPLDEVVREREAQVLRTAYRILGNWADAEDAAQEVFVRLHRKPPAEHIDAGAWLYRVTVNVCLDKVRSARPWAPLPDGPAAGHNAESELLLEERKQALMAALGMLPPKERAAIVLREIEGLPTAEVAAILGSSETTVRSQISKALDRLRLILSKERR